MMKILVAMVVISAALTPVSHAQSARKPQTDREGRLLFPVPFPIIVPVFKLSIPGVSYNPIVHKDPHEGGKNPSHTSVSFGLPNFLNTFSKWGRKR